MNPFWPALASACTAAVFLAGGAGHLLHPRRFAQALRRQRVLPSAVAAPLAVLVGAGEVALGAAALLALAGQLPERGPSVVPVVTAAACFVLAAYLGVLLRMRADAGSCGCTPWEAPLSAFSLVPATVTGGLSVLALAARCAEPVAGPAGLLGALWGLTIGAAALAAPTAALSWRTG